VNTGKNSNDKTKQCTGRRIGIDLLVLSQFSDTGMVSYAMSILPYLFRAMPEFDFVLFCKEGVILQFNPVEHPNVEVVTSRWMKSAWLWKLIGVSVEAWMWRLSLLFLPVSRVPLLKTCKTAVFLHDVGFLSLPQYLLSGTLRSTQLSTWMVAQSADLILTNSCFTRDEFCAHHKISPSRVVVTYLGYEAALFHEAPVTETERARVYERYGVKQPYVLYLGVIQGRKNLAALIEACALWKKAQPELKLVLAGKKGWNCEAIYAAAAQMAEQVQMPGRIATEDLPVLYKLAECYVLPSFYEGFGMPVVESMACGTPNVLSNRTALPEIAAQAAAYFEATDVKAMAEVILDVVDDPSRRSAMQGEGLARCKQFSWESVSSTTANAFKQLLQ
jgi:glycosyltransferase involved in cell wall biosynthesis